MIAEFLVNPTWHLSCLTLFALSKILFIDNESGRRVIFHLKLTLTCLTIFILLLILPYLILFTLTSQILLLCFILCFKRAFTCHHTMDLILEPINLLSWRMSKKHLLLLIKTGDHSLVLLILYLLARRYRQAFLLTPRKVLLKVFWGVEGSKLGGGVGWGSLRARQASSWAICRWLGCWRIVRVLAVVLVILEVIVVAAAIGVLWRLAHF